MKHEARLDEFAVAKRKQPGLNTKHETSPNVQSTNDRKKNIEKSFVWDFGHLDFKFVSDFDIRISDLCFQLRLDADGWGLTL